MSKELLKCPTCNTYTLKENCLECNIQTISPKPAKFKIQDKHQKYRIKAKKELGLI